MKKTSYYEFVHTPTMFGGRVPLSWSVTYFKLDANGVCMTCEELGCYEFRGQAIQARNKHLLSRLDAGEKV